MCNNNKKKKGLNCNVFANHVRKTHSSMIREKNIEERTSIMGTKVVVNLKEERLKLEKEAMKADLQADMSDLINQARQLI